MYRKTATWALAKGGIGSPLWAFVSTPYIQGDGIADIEVVISDITTLNVDVIVNAAIAGRTRTAHQGQLAQVLLVASDESSAVILRNGLAQA